MAQNITAVRAKRSFLGIVLLLAMVPTARSQNLAYGVDVGVGETDNVALVPTDKTNQTMATADLDFALKQQTLSLDTDLKGDFSYTDYLQHAYGNEMLGRFDGTAQLTITPRFKWMLRDDFGQAQLSPFAPPTPSNLENVEYLSTGPELELRAGSAGFLDLNARYVRAQYQTSPFDSNREFASVAWGLRLSERSSVSLDGNSENVQFDNHLVNTDFDRSNAYAHYELKGARTELVANLGATLITPSRGASKSGPLARLQLKRKLSAVAKLSFSGGQELTDASSSFSAIQSGAVGGIGTAPAPQTSSSYTRTYSSLEWRYARNRTSMALSALWEKDAYSGQPTLDDSRSGGEFNIERKLTRALSTQLVGSLYYTQYAHSNFTSRDALGGAVLTWREGRGLEIKLRYNHVSRVATGLGLGFSENVAFLTIGYRPISRND
jgi:hypothetical protein